MQSIKSVNSTVTTNSCNTIGTADGTVQAGNTEQLRKSRALLKAKYPKISEEVIYDLSGSSGSSEGSGSKSSGSYQIKKLSTSSSSSSKSGSNTKFSKFDLSGEKSPEELRKEMQRTVDEVKDEKAATNTDQSQSWLNTIFCGAYDTTGDATLSTMEHTDSESSLISNENSASTSSSVPSSPVKNQSISSILMTDIERRHKGSKDTKSSTNKFSRNSSTSTHATDAALMASSKNGTPKKISFKSKSVDITHSPISPTRLQSGAKSLDIVMELQCDEDLMIANIGKGKKSKGVFKKKLKNYGPIALQSKNHGFKKGGGDTDSVVSERSLFSFASDNSGSRPTNNAQVQDNIFPTAICIAGPANGTFLNITAEDDAENDELAITYEKFRVTERSVDMILNRVGTTIPLYHWQGKNESFKIKTSPSASSDDLGLTSFSTLDLNSPSMKSGNDGEIPAELMNVCSEPSAKTFNVRGRNYLKNGQKVPSGETMFSLLGADNIMKKKPHDNYRARDVSKSPDSYFAKLTSASKVLGLKPPFLIVINFVVPWGNFLSYYYRPDSTKGGPFCESRKSHASEKLWNAFLEGDDTVKNNSLKFIPKILVGPWALKKLVGSQPAMIGQKIPTKYYGSIKDGYMEICMDVTQGGKMANSICSAVASKASALSIDLAFLLQGKSAKELPEQLLTTVRLHHISLKKKQEKIEI